MQITVTETPSAVSAPPDTPLLSVLSNIASA